jgi:ABC-type transport system substrate-binding protein
MYVSSTSIFSLLALIASASAQGTSTVAAAAAASPAPTSQVITIVRPLVNTLLKQNESTLVTWTFNPAGSPAAVGTDTVSFNLADLNKGVNAGRQIFNFGSAPLSQLSFNITIPANITNGSYVCIKLLPSWYTFFSKASFN